jgi:hypothetical protein
MDNFLVEEMESEPDISEGMQSSELPAGLHWDYSGNISTTSENKMSHTPTTVEQDARKLFKSPLDSVMAIFPLLF